MRTNLDDFTKGFEAEEYNSDDDEEDEELEGKYIQTEQSSLGYTIDEERQVVRRFDRKLVPFLALLYLLSFLDRSSM